jgi:hypothetical protein
LFFALSGTIGWLPVLVATLFLVFGGYALFPYTGRMQLIEDASDTDKEGKTNE